MPPYRLKNKFGKRFIRLRELCDYAVDLDLSPYPPQASLMEFLEEHGLLAPICRIEFPAEILRRFAQADNPNVKTIEPVEPDGPRLDAAADLIGTLNSNRWADAEMFGESVHVLDEIASTHAPFVRNAFPVENFIRWKDRRVHLYDTDAGPIYSSNEHHTPSFYHYWQIFWLAAILRSGLHIYYPLDDTAMQQQIWCGELPIEELRRRTYQSINTEAYRELCELREYREHFDLVGYYQAYSNNALQYYAQNRDQHGQIPHQDWRQYLNRERDIARNTLGRTTLDEADFIAFIGKQCEWWDSARRVGPAAISEEYKRNINASIGFLRAATDINPKHIVEAVGDRTGHRRPTLEAIFPDWKEEQRKLTSLSLKRWVDDELAPLPPPFSFTEEELHAFCDWIEEKGLFQYYWHFRRLVDLQRRDDPVHRAASTSEVVGFATLCEMIANEVMIDRGLTPRGNTLFPKLRKLFGPHGPVDLNPLFDRFGSLSNTKSQSLPQRLAQIARITGRGPYSPVLRAMLSLMAIRNEGAHLGLLRFNHIKVIDMIGTLSVASLMIWKAR